MFGSTVMMFPVAAILEKKFLPNIRNGSTSYYQGVSTLLKQIMHQVFRCYNYSDYEI